MLRKHLTVLILYTLIALGLSWPLALNLATAIPGIQGDAASFVWAIGWAKTALADLHVNPFHTDYVFYPLGGATQLLWAISLIGVLAIPLQSLWNLAITHNLLYLAATVLTAYGTYLLATEVLTGARRGAPVRRPDTRPLPPFATFVMMQFILENRQAAGRRSTLAPFAAGLVFAFAPLRMGYGLAFLNLFNTEFIPFYVLCLLRATRLQSWRMALLAGFFLGLNAYVDFQIAAFLILLTVVYAAWTMIESIVQGISARAMLRHAVLWSVTALVSLLVAVPILMAVMSDFADEGGNYIRVYALDYSEARSYDLLAYLLPNARSTLYAATPLKVPNINAAASTTDQSVLSPDRQAFVGYVVLALAAVAVAGRWRAARFWLGVAVLFALSGLGPTLHVAGLDTHIPLPFLLWHEIPIINHIRIPMRYGIVVPLALAMLVALAVDWAQAGVDAHKVRIRKQGLVALRPGTVLGIRLASLAIAVVPVLILAEVAVLPYPLQPLTIPRVYETLARVPGDFTVLEIPSFNWRGAAATSVYQAVHQRRILRTYTNRIAPGPAQYMAYRSIPIVVRSLRILEGIEKGPLADYEIAEDKRARDAVVQFYNLRYAVVHRSLLNADQVRTIDAYVRDVLAARLVDDDGEVLAYEIPPAGPAPDTLAIDLNDNLGQMYAGRGWQFEYPVARWEDQFNFVWAQGAASEVYFVAGEGGERALTVHAYAETPRRVAVVVNGRPAGQLSLGPTWQDQTIVLPAGLVESGMNRVRFEYGADLQEQIGMTSLLVRRGSSGIQTGQ